MGIIAISGGPRAFSSASGGKVYAHNDINAAGNTQIVAANPSRVKLTFHNPGTVDIYVSPTETLNSLGSSTSLVPTLGALGGTFLVFANGGTLSVEGECQGSWQALAASGTTNALTIMDSNT